MNNSSLWTLNWKDILNGVIMAVGTGVLTAILTALTNGGLIDWAAIGIAAAISAIVYLLKNVFTGSQGNLGTNQ